MPVIAIAGNPNCGKTTLFNLLTGARQKVGNWPGVTVEYRSGTARIDGRKMSVVDLPGVYSLLGGGGADQDVARSYLLHSDADLVINIVDAANLERHLSMTFELMQTGKPLVVVMNMVDEAEAMGLLPNPEGLAEALGVPVVPMVARTGRGFGQLVETIVAALREPPVVHTHVFEPAIENPLRNLRAHLPGESYVQKRFEALRLIEDVTEPQTSEIANAVAEAAASIRAMTGEAAADAVAGHRFGWAHDTARRGMGFGDRKGAGRHMTDVIDRVVLSDWLGVPIFLAVLYAVFVVSFSGGNIFLDLFDQVSATLLIDGVGHLLHVLGLPDWLVAVTAGGVGGGLNLVFTFVPPIGLTFVFLALLEDSGYMARAAYAMDRLMRKMGLPGNALVPMIVGFGCNVPAIMGSRIIEDPRGRLLTVLMQPFMSCSARLTIYMAFAVVFFRESGGQVVFALYVLGIVVAFLTALLIGRTAVRGEAMPFVMELPPYRLPSLRSVLLQAWQRLKVFLMRVGRVIAAIGIVLFILPGIGWTGSGIATTDIEHSFLAEGSKALTPLFTPMGIEKDNWPAVSGLIAGAAAKEIVIGALNGIYQRQDSADQMARYRDPDLLGQLVAALQTVPDNAVALVTTFGDPLGLAAFESSEAATEASGASNATLKAIAEGFTPLSAFAYLVFVLLYVPCAAAMGALKREVGWGWMGFSVAYGVGLGWGAATLIYQTGTFAAHPQSSALWIAGVLGAFGLLIVGLRLIGDRTVARARLRLAEQRT
ncbi:MAG: Fe(2+) transporter permease subunit FeoB [Alphaproteobacteria bacterium]|nr:Fe(2+) transporter permease subunit FeoB [Alphaproteobacteria bacterium]